MDDLYAINLAKSRFREGHNLGDEEMVLSIYGDTFCDMSFAMPSFYDTDARDVLRTKLKSLFRDYRVEMSVIVISVTVNGDEAFDWGWHVLTLTPKTGGESHRVRTRYFETWKKDAKRGWLIARYIDNLDEAPTMPQDLIRELESTGSDALITRLGYGHSQSAETGRTSDAH